MAAALPQVWAMLFARVMLLPEELPRPPPFCQVKLVTLASALELLIFRIPCWTINPVKLLEAVRVNVPVPVLVRICEPVMV